ncbi:hypothetical protein PRN20_10305 [Devosia sp. ZB163]|uniref:hypothetical protein n=1 Tax=Devosia sp. ZB163 TaxID=3025938 RepID=UPI0023615B37|nr:hypothetical protein [Devosia sp. ZB163]MDC9824130.1 hypothetical protein [Devosia sp. ZB163]
MLNPAHILETAFLLLVAFLIGATVGSLARLAVLRMSRAPTVQQATPVPKAEVIEAPAALVTAPAIEPMSKPATPAAPAEVPAPDFTEAVQAIEAARPGALTPLPEVRMPTLAPLPTVETREQKPVMSPARVAGQTTSGLLVASPRHEPAGRSTAPAGGPSAEVIPFPIDRTAEMPVEVTVTADAVDAVLEPEQFSESAATTPTEVAVVSVPEPFENAEAEPAEAPGADSAVAVQALVAEPEAIAPRAPAPQPAETVASKTDDEGAAMRAIEGNWTPTRNSGSRARPAEAPDGVDAEPAPSRRRASRQAATEIDPAPAESPGKPVGIEAPRQGISDSLANVIGILPIIEKALNKLGLYHFDQIANLTDENVEWIEAHLGIDGRIGREHWREQARELALISEPGRKVAAQP